MLGWIPPSLRPAHLIFTLLTLGSWWLLGYCPLTRAHWKVKQAYGQGFPKEPYIAFVVKNFAGSALSPESVDSAVVLLTLLVTAFSLFLNLKKFVS